MAAINRRIFIRTCLNFGLSAETVMEYTNQMIEKTDEEKELMAEKFTMELEEKWEKKNSLHSD